MNRKLALNIVLNAKNAATGPMAAVLSGSKRLNRQLRRQRETLKTLNRAQSQVESFSRLNDESQALAESVKNAEQRVVGLRQKMQQASQPSEKLVQRLAAAKDASARLATQQQNTNTKLENARQRARDLAQQLNDTAKPTKKLIRDHDAAQRKLERLTETQHKHTAALLKAQQRQQKLSREMEQGSRPTKKLIRDYEAAKRAADKLKTAQQHNIDKLEQMRGRLSAAGVNTKDLAGEQKRLASEISNTTDKINQQKSKITLFNTLQNRVKKIGGAAGNVMHEGGKLAKRGLLALGAAGYFFKTQFVDTAAEFENYEAILRVVEGSAGKARKSLNWVSGFAAETPYQLAQVTDAFVKMRSYGLDPTNGLLRTLGDTSAAMNKPLMQAVEAMADAVTGQNERLIDFGIRGSVKGQKINYEYTNKAGEQQSASVNKNDRKAIENTLRTIWNEKYGGSMRERSRTWEGMLNNMGDQWTRFVNTVMGAGLFDWMKTKLGGFLDKVDQMAADGTLQKTAQEWGENIKNVAVNVWNLGSAIGTAINDLSNMVGGGKNLALVIAGISLAPLIASVVTLGIALGPVGLAITAVVTGISAIALNWEKIVNWVKDDPFAAMVTSIKTLARGFGPIGTMITTVVNGLSAVSRYIPDFFSDDASPDSTAPSVPTTTQQPPVLTYNPSANGMGISIGDINVTATPGMDTEDVANKVMAKLKAEQRAAQKAKRSRMGDID